ncbi:MAG TPA: cation-translocating P-type ATPase [Noviherbaspirillum sp.]
MHGADRLQQHRNPTVSGLSEDEAARRLREDGYNELPHRRARSVFDTAVDVAREPMFLLLLAAGAIYLLLGDTSDALLLLGFVIVSMAISILQGRRTDRTLERLKDLSSPRALVLRDSVAVRLPGREVVAGDILLLEEGDRVAADGVLIESHDLLVDESLLTGESLPVSKDSQAAATTTVYAGTMVVRGGGMACIHATGPRTEFGRIGATLQSVHAGDSPLQREIRSLIKRFAWFGAGISCVAFLLHVALRDDWFGGLLTGIALAMSTLPEEFTVVFTAFMALGAWRIAKTDVLTRHMPVIEALGRATVLCVDKTGTLTQNRMSVAAVVAPNGQRYTLGERHPRAVPDGVRDVLVHAVLASEVLPFDPMEKALQQELTAVDSDAARLLKQSALVHEYPLTTDLLAMTHVWSIPGRATPVVATKGAPEAVGRLCGLDAERNSIVLRQAESLAAQGMRVLAVGKAEHQGQVWPHRPNGFRFSWLGLVALADPLRPEVPAAIAQCREAGIRVVMITGDYPATARTIARDAGLPWERIVTGDTLRAAGDTEWKEIVRSAHVFARVRPEQKLRLVEAFKSEGQVVAMTGDGINDAPALKAAHIGIAMGNRGTDVAREASSLVLLNDDFASIVRTIRLGRHIYDNLRKALTYVVAVHVPIAGMVLLSVLLGTPYAFAPVHIVFLEMIINPACALVFEPEPEHRDLMKIPPRTSAEALFGTRDIVLAVLLGTGIFAAAAAVFLANLDRLGAGQARALGFATVVLGNLALIVSSRSLHIGFLSLLRIPNRAQWWILSTGCLALAAVAGTPALRAIFHFSEVNAAAWLSIPVAVAAMVVWFESIKQIFARKTLNSNLCAS